MYQKQMTNNDDDNLDQEQIIGNISSEIYEGRIVAQTFKPSETTLTRIQLYLKRNGQPNSNVSFIVSQSQNGPYLINMNISTSSIHQDTRQWVEFDFENIKVNIDTTYYIILKMQAGDEFNNIQWYASDTDTYQRGYKLRSEDNGETWQQEILHDCTFKTYGASSYDLDILYMVGGSGAKIDYSIQNTGAQDITQLIVQLDIQEGLGFMLTGKQYSKTLNLTIQPGESFQDFIYPVLGIGAFSKVTLRIAPNTGPYKEIQRDIIFLLPYIYLKPLQ